MCVFYTVFTVILRSVVVLTWKMAVRVNKVRVLLGVPLQVLSLFYRVKRISGQRRRILWEDTWYLRRLETERQRLSDEQSKQSSVKTCFHQVRSEAEHGRPDYLLNNSLQSPNSPPFKILKCKGKTSWYCMVSRVHYHPVVRLTPGNRA